MNPLVGKQRRNTLGRRVVTAELPSRVDRAAVAMQPITSAKMIRAFYAFESSLWIDRSGAELTFQRFERFHDGPVIPRGQAGSHDEHRVYSINVWRDVANDRFVAWYSAMRHPDPDPWKQNGRHALCIAYSHDGVSWEKPDLRLPGSAGGDGVHGSPDNRLLIPAHFYCAGVIYDGSQFVMKYEFPASPGSTQPNTTFCILTSKDGIAWAGERRPLIREAHFESANSIYRLNGRYHVMGQGISPYFKLDHEAPFGRVNFVYSSADLKKWTLEPEVAFAYPSREYFPDATLQTHCGATVCDRGRIQLGFMGQFWPAGFSESVRSTFGLIYSYDGLKWQEPLAGQPLLLPDEQSWDCGMLMQGNGLYSRGEYTYYWYTGMDGGNTWGSRGATGICRIRRDGFACLAPTAGEAVLRTAEFPIDKTDRFLFVNCDLAGDAFIEVALIDVESGQEICSKRLARSGFAVEAFDLSAIRSRNQRAGSRRVGLRFVLRGKARLYAFYTAPDDSLNRQADDFV